MQDVEAEHAGDLHPGILINCRRIELQDVALPVEREVGELKVEAIAIDL